MQPRLHSFTAVLGRSSIWPKAGRPVPRLRPAQFVCRSCEKRFFSASILRQALKPAAKTAEKEQMYKSRLLIYDAGDTRTTWVSFWKAMALLQFGTTLVFGVPLLWNNENQPDVKLRKSEAILVGILGTIPTLTMAYLTAPFTHQIFLQIPSHARRSRQSLMAFARTLTSNPPATANTKVEFVTLRIFPFRKRTTAFLHELRTLPSQKFRLANIELPKSEDWATRQRAKGIFRRMYEVVNEPRFKFYVKEGRLYTMKTGVPGVWEEVARRIQEQTLAERRDAGKQKEKGLGAAKKQVVVRVPVKPVKVERERVRRQTSRPTAEAAKR